MCVVLEENIQQFGAKNQQVNITEQLSFSSGCVRVPSTQSFLAGEGGICVLGDHSYAIAWLFANSSCLLYIHDFL